MSIQKNLITLCFATVFTLGLAACGGGGGGTPTAMPEPEPVTDYCMTGTAEQCLAQRQQALRAAEAALAALGGSATIAEQGAAQKAVSDATTAVAAAQKVIDDDAADSMAVADRETARMAAETAIAAAMTAVGALDATSSAEDIEAARALVMEANTAAGVAHLSMAQMDGFEARIAPIQTTLSMADQRHAISATIATARAAVTEVGDDATEDEVTAADDAVAAAAKAIVDAANVPEAEKAAHRGTVAALTAQLSTAKESRQIAMDDAAEAQRMVNIAAAEGVLTSAEAALEALGDDATDQQNHDAQRMVEAAANALRDALRMNGGSATEIEAAIRMSARAMVAADALQATITAAANAEEQRKMAAINTAQTALTAAEVALMELGEDATDKEKRDAHRAVEREAAALLQVLEDNDGTAGQITAATMKRDSAMQMADALTSPIVIADQRKAITDALSQCGDSRGSGYGRLRRCRVVNEADARDCGREEGHRGRDRTA